MRKNIAVMTVTEKSAISFCEIFKEIYGDLVDVYCYSHESAGYDNMIEADLYFIGATSSDVFEHARSCIPSQSEVVMSNLTFKKKNIEPLKQRY